MGHDVIAERFICPVMKIIFNLLYNFLAQASHKVLNDDIC